MKKKTFGVMAGTYIDTKFGVKLVKHLADSIISMPISATPAEQTHFQTMESDKRYQMIKKEIEKHSAMDCVLVYCNSFSGTVDFDRLSEECQLPIVTPLHFYRHIAGQLESFGVISANAQGSAGIEKTLLDQNPTAQIFSVANLGWVNAIENQVAPEVIYKDLGLREATHFFEQLQVDGLILGCTHFPYFQEYLQKQTSLKCINPDNFLLKQVNSFLLN